VFRRAGRAAAWDAYLALTCGLLPALDGTDDRAVNAGLGGLAVRIRRYAPLWPGQGPRLLNQTYEAIGCWQRGDYDRLAEHLDTLAADLFTISSGRVARQSRLHPPGT